MSKTKADKAKRAAKAKAKAKADKAKEANANKATTTAKATAHSSEARVAPTAAALLSFHAGGAPSDNTSGGRMLWNGTCGDGIA